jgi:hypothetical protein
VNNRLRASLKPPSRTRRRWVAACVRSAAMHQKLGPDRRRLATDGRQPAPMLCGRPYRDRHDGVSRGRRRLRARAYVGIGPELAPDKSARSGSPMPAGYASNVTARAYPASAAAGTNAGTSILPPPGSPRPWSLRSTWPLRDRSGVYCPQAPARLPAGWSSSPQGGHTGGLARSGRRRRDHRFQGQI